MNMHAQLTGRQTEVARLIAWGAAKKEVAGMLGVSVRTVEAETREIFRKIGIQKSTELCVWWFCTHHNVPISQSPIKRAITGLFLLIVFIPSISQGVTARLNRLPETRRLEARAPRRDINPVTI